MYLKVEREASSDAHAVEGELSRTAPQTAAKLTYSASGMTKGWLRASHRKLDAERSLPYRPYHAHNERQWLKAGEIVECRIEVWPTSMVFKRGHRIRIDIQPRDGAGSAPYTHYHADYNAGAENTIYAGGDMPSHLLLPIIPAK